MEFERYQIRMSPKEAASGPSKTLALPALIKNPDDRNRGELMGASARLCWRWMLALLAIPLSFVNPRAGRTNNLILAVLVLPDLQQRGPGVCQSWIGQGARVFDVGLLVPHVVMLPSWQSCSPADQRLRALAETLMIPVYVRYLGREIYAAVLLVLLAFLGLFRVLRPVNELDEVGKGGTCCITPPFTGDDHAGPENELMPIAVLIGTLYALTTFARHPEITVLRASACRRRVSCLRCWASAASLWR